MEVGGSKWASVNAVEVVSDTKPAVILVRLRPRAGGYARPILAKWRIRVRAEGRFRKRVRSFIMAKDLLGSADMPRGVGKFFNAEA